MTFSDDLKECLEDGLGALFDWVQGAGSGATGAQAKATIKNWIDNNYPMFATQEFGDLLIDRVLPIYDPADNWVSWRNKTNAYRAGVKTQWVREVLSAIQ